MNNEPLTMDQMKAIAPSAFASQPHESRSSRYQYIPTSNIIERMMSEGFLPFTIKQSRCRDLVKRDYTKHMIRFRHTSYLGTNRAVGDIFPEVVLVNSHDGSSAYELMAGLFRLICMNGAVVSESQFASLHIRHQGNVIDQVLEGSYKVAEYAPKALDTVQRWQDIVLEPQEQLVLAAAAHQVRFADTDGHITTPITPDQLLATHRDDDSKPDLWHTFNRIQENSIRGGLSAVKRDEHGRRLRRVRTRGINNIDQDVNLNRALWQLAERMAELKQAA